MDIFSRNNYTANERIANEQLASYALVPSVVDLCSLETACNHICLDTLSQGTYDRL